MMERRICAMGLLAGLLAAAAAAETVSGVVFHDRNGNGLRDSGERGIKGVAVSNGLAVIETDRHGAYTLSVTDDCVIFVIKPRGWMVPVNADNVPQFFYVHKPAGSRASKFPGVAPTGPLPESVDFPLTKQRERTAFEAILMGDTQVGYLKQIDWLAADVISELAGTEASFVLTLGDNVDNNLAMFEPLTAVLGEIGVPVFYTHGNHDTNQDAPGDADSDESIARVFGPPYYAFTWGKTHFIVLENIHWNGDGYHGAFGEEQLTFVRNDLAFVPEDWLVVVTMHIPLPDAKDGKALLELLGDRPHTFSVSAHWHTEEHIFLGEKQGWPREEPHHHLVNGAVCGSWWSGVPDEEGLPPALMADGTPNGYVWAHFGKDDYRLRYKVARRPADYQMAIHMPGEVVAGAAAGVVVNVFFGAKSDPVEMRVDDGPWTVMEHTLRPDPFVQALNALEKKVPEGIMGRVTPEPKQSTHVWTASLPTDLAPGGHTLHVRTTDNFGTTHTGQRVFRVVP